MEHGKKNRKFGRQTKQRSSLMRGLMISLIENGKITTTEAKAKSLKVDIEKLITKCGNNNLASIKYLTSFIGKVATSKMIKEIGPNYLDRNGGYTRIRKLARRVSDGSPMALIEFVK
jgi:large subunit ribosomal protein L17